MRIYSVIEQNYQKALEAAKAKHGNNIQVLYQREVLYGVFAKRWVELGYYVKSYGADKIVPVSVDEDEFSLYLKDESDRLFKLMVENDYSYRFTRQIVDSLVSSRLVSKKIYEEAENNDFVYKKIFSRLRYDYESSSTMPDVMCLVSPYSVDRKRVVENLLSFYGDSDKNDSQSVVNLINISTEPVVAHNSGYTYNCENTASLLGIISNMSDYSNIIINLDEKFCHDFEFYRSLDDVKNILKTQRVCVYLMLPLHLRNTEVKKLKAINDYIKSIIVSGYKKGDSFGNIISIADELGKEILFFEGEHGVELATLPKLKN